MRALIVPLLLLAPLPASAQAAPLCHIEVKTIDFGTYSSLDPAANTAIGQLSVLCARTAGSAPTPHVRLGTGDSGYYLDRYMLSGVHQLHYNIYADPSRRLVLGDGSAGTVSFPAPRTRALGHASWPLFGVIPARQRVPAGDYSDTLLIEVEF